jgi:hypothetical protein
MTSKAFHEELACSVLVVGSDGFVWGILKGIIQFMVQLAAKSLMVKGQSKPISLSGLEALTEKNLDHFLNTVNFYTFITT